jgi:hypothetical protein
MPSPVPQFNPDGPIPGENYTSDTRNYPWHRPPEITDIDKGIEASIKQLTTREASYALLTMLQSGVPVATCADIFVTSGIGAGKWTPDFAILLAGPVAHMMKLMADGYGVKYDMGLDDEHIPTIEFVKAHSKIDPSQAVKAAENVASQAERFKGNVGNLAPQGGFMGMPSPVNPDAVQQGANMAPEQQASMEG